MSNLKNRFKKFGGEFIPDIIEYLKDCIQVDPTVTITVGCDSIQKRKKTIYAITIMLYNTDIKRGAHVVFFRESCPKIRDTQERLYKEAQYLHDVGTFINDELENFYIRTDITDIERRKYKYHLLEEIKFSISSIVEASSIISSPITVDIIFFFLFKIS